MRIAVVCKSDATGGAAVVSRRLTEALRLQGEEAVMLVLEKKTDLPYVVKIRYPILKPLAFVAERLRIFFANRFSRKNLWKIDTGEFGLPIWRHPVVRNADMVILNWVNQGMLSLKGVERICRMGKRVVWTMHDMWNFTGICHHAMDCRRFEKDCADCPLSSPLGHKIWEKKRKTYRGLNIEFVAVSNWLAREARKSSLLGDAAVKVIHNPFRSVEIAGNRNADETKTILFVAAGLDNWIKGLSTLRMAINRLKDREIRLLLAGDVKDPEALRGFETETRHLGVITDEKKLAEIYSKADIIVNASHFENLPGTLIEGQAYGAIPVAFDRGGQRDIIDDGTTGFLAQWDDDEERRAANLASAIGRALDMAGSDSADEFRRNMRESVERFSYENIARSYLGRIQ